LPIDPAILNRLKSQTERAGLVLFTGAGFSWDAKDRQGRQLSTVSVLKNELWQICFPGDPFDPTASLGDLYEVALNTRKAALGDFMASRMSVDAASLPDYYKAYFDFPWLRIYTLNVDDLAAAVVRRFPLRRGLQLICATANEATEAPTSRSRGPLEVVHLNGWVAAGKPELLTFSDTQYAERISNREPWYSRCAADLEARPFIFIGTELNEIPLWQHVELRKRRTIHGRDLRPTSILVTPTLNIAKQAKLRDLRIEWIQGTAETFATEVLAAIQPAANQGFVFLGEYAEGSGRQRIPLVTELAAERPNLDTNYLLGDEPQWADLIQHRAVERANDASLLATAAKMIEGDPPNSALAVTGTAGTGKSTALMSLGLAMSDRGVPVLWIDRDSDVAPVTIRRKVLESSLPLALLIDDADMLGHQLVGLMRDVVPDRKGFLFAIGIRSGRLDDIAIPLKKSSEIKLVEHAIPFLADDDIDKLIATLDRHNRLGPLKGLDEKQRRSMFAAYAGRQLLVAMIGVTSGQRFEQKAANELVELTGMQRYVYALVNVVTSLRHYLLKDEILLACGDQSQDALDAINSLTARGLIVAPPPTYRYRARHRVVADLVVEKLRELDELADAMRGLLFALGSKVNPALDRNARPWRVLSRLMNHELLLRLIGPRHARSVYEGIEGLLNYDYHYWLQRGSVEVEAGDVRLAENFLSQARSLAQDDHKVETEYGYLLFKKALLRPDDVQASDFVDRAIDILEGVITARGSADPHPFHVLGTQGLDWSNVATMDGQHRRRFLDRLVYVVNQGREMHPAQKELAALLDQLRRAALLTVVPAAGESRSD